MTHPMIIWYGIVAAVLLIFLVDFIAYLVGRHRSAAHRHCRCHSLISICREKDMFYAPGDPATGRDDELLQDDYEDL